MSPTTKEVPVSALPRPFLESQYLASQRHVASLTVELATMTDMQKRTQAKWEELAATLDAMVSPLRLMLDCAEADLAKNGPGPSGGYEKRVATVRAVLSKACR